MEARAHAPDPYQNVLGSNATRSATGSSTGSSPSSSLHLRITEDTGARGHKRKLQAAMLTEDTHDYYAANEVHGAGSEGLQPKERTKATSAGADDGEKRLRRFRDKPPASFTAIFDRATTQRFFVLSRSRGGTQDCPELHLQVSGSTGNIYNVSIARQPTCDCPHARAGNQCKHTVFVLKKVLRAKPQYVYQLALLSAELKDIFNNAPDATMVEDGPGHEDNNRKPVEGDCPICFEEMMSGPGKEELVWCRAACGQNIHRLCFEMWATTKRQEGGNAAATKITCPYCRSSWEGDEELTKAIDVKQGRLTREGYYNVADQVGVSTQRDYRTYSTWRGGYRRPRRRFFY